MPAAGASRLAERFSSPWNPTEQASSGEEPRPPLSSRFHCPLLSREKPAVEELVDAPRRLTLERQGDVAVDVAIESCECPRGF
jgi:hypothetical protein